MRIFSSLKQKLECLNRTQTLLNFGFFFSASVHEYSFKTGVISKGKWVASSCEIASEFRQPPAHIENPDTIASACFHTL